MVLNRSPLCKGFAIMVCVCFVVSFENLTLLVRKVLLEAKIVSSSSIYQPSAQTLAFTNGSSESYYFSFVINSFIFVYITIHHICLYSDVICVILVFR